MFKKVSMLVGVLLVGLLVACGGGDGAEDSVLSQYLDDNGAELVAEFEAMGMDVNLSVGTGNEFVLVTVIDDEMLDGIMALGEDVGLEMLEGMIVSMGSIFEIAAADVRDELELDDFRWTIVYEDSNGNELVRESFDAN